MVGAGAAFEAVLWLGKGGGSGGDGGRRGVLSLGLGLLRGGDDGDGEEVGAVGADCG